MYVRMCMCSFKPGYTCVRTHNATEIAYSHCVSWEYVGLWDIPLYWAFSSLSCLCVCLCVSVPVWDDKTRWKILGHNDRIYYHRPACMTTHTHTHACMHAHTTLSSHSPSSVRPGSGEILFLMFALFSLGVTVCRQLKQCRKQQSLLWLGIRCGHSNKGPLETTGKSSVFLLPKGKMYYLISSSEALFNQDPGLIKMLQWFTFSRTWCYTP